MKFNYDKLPNPLDPTRPWILKPHLRVRLFYQDPTRYADILALVDSGADLSLFHASVGRLLGIDVTQGRPIRFRGVSGTGFTVYLHTIHLQIRGARGAIALEAGFTDAPIVKAILGQVGLFDAYRITFERAKERIEIVRVRGR